MIASSGEYIDMNDWYEASSETLVSGIFIDGCRTTIEKYPNVLVLVVYDEYGNDGQWVSLEREDITTLIGMLQRAELILAERDSKHV